MKRNFILTIAVAVLMLASEVAWAADVSFSGQFRPRYNSVSDFTDSTNPDRFFNTRVRLNAKANVNANTTVFLQFQSVGQWGTDESNATDDDLRGTRVQQGGGGAAFEANDRLADVGFHQAFVTLKNFHGTGVDAKVGRQEIVLDGHRLFGHTGWTQGAATQDAIRLTHAAGNATWQYIYMENLNAGNSTAMGHDDDATHAFHVNTQGVLGGSLSGYFVISDDESAFSAAADNIMDDENTWYTIGARQKGKMGGLDYRVEYYHQFGDGAVPAGDMNWSTAYTDLSDSADIDRDAHMFGVRVGKTFKNVTWSPTITLWYDSLSGSDDGDASGNDYGGFDTLYDTGHKFYGFMDLYLNRQNLGTGGMGLEDLALKTKFNVRPGWVFKMDVHSFHTQTDMDGDNPTIVAANTSLNNSVSQSNSLGTEYDLTLVHKYDANTKIAAGYSHYESTETFGLLNGGASTAGLGANDDSDWIYVQLDTKF